MGLFSKMELMIMISTLGGVLFIILLLTILDFIDERKEKKNIIVNENNDNIKKVDVKEQLIVEEEIEVLDFDEPIIEMKEELDNNVVIANTVEEVVIEEKKEEIVKQVVMEYEEIGFEEIIPNKKEDTIIPLKSEEEKAKETLNKIEKQLQKEESYEDTITNFELEQEESAIISYDELIKVSDKLYTQNETVQYDDGNEPITIDEVIKRFASNDMTFENTANLDKLNREYDKDKNFVNIYESK